MVHVSWYEADAYARWAGKRLPTDAEWEYAARGTAGRKYPWGDPEPTDQHANFRMRVGHPSPVGVYSAGATPEGILDLAGNVWEWCADWFGPYEARDVKDPQGPKKGKARVLRGGAFGDHPWSLRAACRFRDLPEGRVGHFGFRCVRAAPGGRD